MRRLVIIAMLLFLPLTIHGQEQVVKMAAPWPGQGTCVYLMAQRGANGNDHPYPPCMVTVINDQDTRKLIADAQQATQTTDQTNLEAVNKSLNYQINNLQNSIKALSDANDALTKRLNDLEQKVDKQSQTSGARTVLPKAEIRTVTSHGCTRPGHVKRTGAGKTTLRVSVNEGSHPRS